MQYLSPSLSISSRKNSKRKFLLEETIGQTRSILLSAEFPLLFWKTYPNGGQAKGQYTRYTNKYVIWQILDIMKEIGKEEEIVSEAD